MLRQQFEVLVDFLRKNSTKNYSKHTLLDALKAENQEIFRLVFDDAYLRNDVYSANDWLAYFIKSQFFGYDLGYFGPADIEVFDEYFRPVRQFTGVFRVIGNIKDEDDTEVDFQVTLEDGRVISFDPYTMRIMRNR